MNINPAIYKSLTPRQRIIATVEAMARDDENEENRLKETCPVRAYQGADIAYSMTMQMLMSLSIAHENELRGYVIYVLIGVIADNDQLMELALQQIANIEAGWREAMDEMGIDAATMQKAGIPPHPVLEFYTDMLPEPDAHRAEQYRAGLLSCLNKTGSL